MENGMQFHETLIPDLWVIQQNTFFDARGSFIKTFQKTLFSEMNFSEEFVESYFTESRAGVVRGMHFQSPPSGHAKLATVVSGRILDVVLDLRQGSPSYGKIFSVELSRANSKSIMIPAGCAHGFCALVDNSIVYYSVTSEYSRNDDHGVHPLSLDFEWPMENPVLSDRDAAFPKWSDFKTPFIWSRR
jgi:dTDP-4-dehydrorhamnose 3,5-epimerase